MRIFAIFAILGLAACDVNVSTGPSPSPTQQPVAVAQPKLSSQAAARQFVNVVRTIEPVAEAECRRRAPSLNCDFDIRYDGRPGVPSNAFQTLDKNGRPVLIFTLPLIKDVRNADEMAFIVAHEAAHHIQNHLARQRQNAIAGAVLAGSIAAVTGASSEAVAEAQRVGAQVGARRYSKDFELEADQLGTIITIRAGYDPVRGAAYFTRIPDPGDRFLGTHPPNTQRIDVVRKTAAGL